MGRAHMTTLLDKTLKRELRINGRPYIVTLSSETLKLTNKGKRKGLELRWDALVSGDAALAVALTASLGAITPQQRAGRPAGVTIKPPKVHNPTKRRG